MGNCKKEEWKNCDSPNGLLQKVQTILLTQHGAILLRMEIEITILHGIEEETIVACALRRQCRKADGGKKFCGYWNYEEKNEESREQHG